MSVWAWKFWEASLAHEDRCCQGKTGRQDVCQVESMPTTASASEQGGRCLRPAAAPRQPPPQTNQSGWPTHPSLCLSAPALDFQYIDAQLPAESPYLYGLHPNAEIGFLTQTSEKLFRTVLELQPQDSHAGDRAGATREEKVCGGEGELPEILLGHPRMAQ